MKYFSKYEVEKYNEGLEKLEYFNDYMTFVNNMSDFFWELKILYINVTREMGTPNVWSRKEYASPEFLEDVKLSLDKYNELL